MPKKAPHTHKFIRHRFKTGSAVYFCVLDCKYKIPTPLALGKKAICWRCESEFVLNEYSVRLAKPHCEKCHISKDGKVKLPVGLNVNTSPENSTPLQNALAEVHTGEPFIPDILTTNEIKPTPQAIEESLASKLNRLRNSVTITTMPLLHAAKADNEGDI